MTNTGTGPSTLSAAGTITRDTGTGSWAVKGGTCVKGVTLAAAGGSCTVTATYTPPSGGPPLSTAHVVLTGTGFAAATANAAPMVIGN